MLARSSALTLLLASLPGLSASAIPAGEPSRRECERLNESGSYALALPHCLAALEALRTSPEGTRADDSELGKALTSAGLALEMTGDREAAETSYREALALHRSAARSELEALVLSNLAALAIGGGDYGGALAWLEEEEAVARRALAAGEASWAVTELDYARINRSVALEQLGAYPEALTELRPVAAGGDGGDAAALSVNLAVLYRNLGDPRRAMALLDRARTIYERIGDRSALANVHLNRGLVLQINLHQPAAALMELEHALELAQSSGDRGEEIRTLCALGDLHLQGRRFVAARGAFTLASAAAATADAAAGGWAAEAGLGRVDRELGDSDAALLHLRRAIEEIERAGAGLESSALRGGLLADQRAVYATAVDLLAERALAAGDRQATPATVATAATAALNALALAERAKARELLDALAGGPAAPLDEEELAALAPRLGPTFAYFFGERTLWRFELENGRWKVARAGEPKAIGVRVARVHRSLAGGETPAADDLQQLADMLLPATFAAGVELRIVPDGRLFYLPFELLPDPQRDGAMLIERATISYLPGVAVLSHLHPPVASPRWQVTALADPAPPSPSPSQSAAGAGSVAELLARRFGLPPLPGAAREARAAADRMGEPSAVDVGADATEARLRRRAGEGARVLHLAAHTVVDEALAGGVALFLAPGPLPAVDPRDGSGLALDPDPEDDGLVTAPELSRLKLDAELAVLSGCRTALAETSISGGDGAGGGRALASLSGALLAAGARGVVASLWEVGDAATAALMEQFYFELARGRRPAVALRRAKLRLAHDPRWAAAPAWAGFVLLGDPQAVAPASAWQWGLALALGLVVGGSGVLMLGSGRRRRR